MTRYLNIHKTSALDAFCLLQCLNTARPQLLWSFIQMQSVLIPWMSFLQLTLTSFDLAIQYLIVFRLMLVMLLSVYCKSCEIAVVDTVFTYNVFIWIKTIPLWFILKMSIVYKRLEDTTWLFKSEQASHTCWLCKWLQRKNWASYNKWQTTNSCRNIMINEILSQNIKHVWHLQSERNQSLKLRMTYLCMSYTT